MELRIPHFYALILMLALNSASLPSHAANPSLMGPLGLNTVPSARMDASGTARLSVSTLDPYAHVHLGFQIAKPLYIGLRQSAEISSLTESADRLYPGLDFKLRLLQESAYLPEISLGMQSAFGHKRMAGEYLAASKKWKNFDFTGGIGWGRFAGAGKFGNPLNALSGHFGKQRDRDGDNPSDMDNWFTGEEAGLFAGIEYDTPFLEGLSLKADWGGVDYEPEKAASDFSAPAPWSLGFNYNATPWLSLGAAVAGADKIMGRISIQGPLDKWPRKMADKTKSEPMRPHRTSLNQPSEMELAAQRDDIALYSARNDDSRTSWALLETTDNTSLPQQLGRAARHMANHAGPDTESLQIIPTHYGLRGPAVRLIRTDLERALARNQGSPQEIWRDTEFKKDVPEDLYGPALTRPWRNWLQPGMAQDPFYLVLDNQLSVSEEDHGVLYRTSLIGEGRRLISTHLMAGAAARLDLSNNLDDMMEYRPRALLPVRSDIDRFAGQRVSLDRLYLAWTGSLSADFHAAIATGQLEEMYSGAGGEILYRPFGKNFALGADAWQVFKRDPDSMLNLALSGDHILTGHINAWYEIPQTDLTLQARFGRFLAGDTGLSLSLDKRLDNQVRLGAFATLTDNADLDLFGGISHLYSGLRLSLPFGDTPVTPNGSRINITAAPLGRETGQALDAPLSLYEMTEKFSTGHIARHWTEIVE